MKIIIPSNKIYSTDLSLSTSQTKSINLPINDIQLVTTTKTFENGSISGFEKVEFPHQDLKNEYNLLDWYLISDQSGYENSPRKYISWCNLKKYYKTVNFKIKKSEDNHSVIPSKFAITSNKQAIKNIYENISGSFSVSTSTSSSGYKSSLTSISLDNLPTEYTTTEVYGIPNEYKVSDYEEGSLTTPHIWEGKSNFAKDIVSAEIDSENPEYYNVNIDILYAIGVLKISKFFKAGTLSHSFDNGTLEEYTATSIDFQLWGECYTLNIEENTLTAQKGDEGAEIVLNSNNFIQNKYKDDFQNDINILLEKYKNGKTTATILCAIGEYYDTDGKSIISTKKADKMFFEHYDEVVPFYKSHDGFDAPISLTEDYKSKTFLVLGSEIYFDGAVWQKLQLQEFGSTNITNGTEGLEYEYDKSTKTFSAKGIGTATDKDIVIASQVNGKYVDKILNNSFMDSDIESVVIPETIKTIESDKNDVYSGAFYNCKNLSKVYFNAIEMEDLENSPFKSAGSNAPNGLQLVVGKKATKIPSYIFYFIGSIAPNIRELHFEGNSNCHTIGEYAFGGCRYLPIIDIPDSVVEIGEHCFYNDSYLSQTKEIKIGKHLRTLGNYAFDGNGRVEKIYFNAEEMEDFPTSKSNIFNECGIRSTNGITVYIGKDVKRTPSNLYYCTNPPNISKVVFDKNSICSSIGKYSFDSLASLKIAIIRGYVTTIKSSAFSWDSNLENVVFPKWLKIIENYAFRDCNNISKIFFEGSADEWDIDIGDASQGSLLTATIYYYSETAPITSGNYWHYDENDEPIIW